MLQDILLLIFNLFKEGERVVLPAGAEFTIRLCATDVGIIYPFGSPIKTETCRNVGYGTATDGLSGTPHWCLQDNVNVTKDSRTVLIPSGCSLWVKKMNNMPNEKIDRFDKTGLMKLSQVRRQQIKIPRGIVETEECVTHGEGLNSGSHDLLGTDYWCRQQMISLHLGEDKKDNDKDNNEDNKKDNDKDNDNDHENDNRNGNDKENENLNKNHYDNDN